MKWIKELLEDFKEDRKIFGIKRTLYWWFVNPWWWKIKQFYRSVKNIIIWTPLLWKDRDWDYTFLYLIIVFKIKNMRKHLDKTGQEIRKTLNPKLKSMKRVEFMLNRKANHNYFTKADMKFLSSIKYTTDFSFKMKGTSQEIKRKTKLRDAIYDRVEEMAKNDLIQSMDIIKNESEGWWE